MQTINIADHGSLLLPRFAPTTTLPELPPIIERNESTNVPHLTTANNESSKVCGIIKPGRRVKLNRLLAVMVNKLLTIRYLPAELRTQV